jgi:hypothetical protein
MKTNMPVAIAPEVISVPAEIVEACDESVDQQTTHHRQECLALEEGRDLPADLRRQGTPPRGLQIAGGEHLGGWQSHTLVRRFLRLALEHESLP